jgi:hypothetical protein
MLQPPCEICGQASAFHETVIEEGKAVTRHYCQAHGEEGWRAAAPPPDAESQAGALQAMAEAWGNLSQPEKEQLAELYRLSKRRS